MSDWQDIETAPRDGSSFLAYMHHGHCWFIIIAEFSKHGVLFDTNGDSSVAWDPTGKFGRKLEHRPMWQPLPEPPVKP